MNVEDMRELYPLYIDGELSAAELRRVEEFLRAHPEEAVEVERYRRALELMRKGAQAPGVSPAQWNEVMESVRTTLETESLLDDVEQAVASVRPSRILPYVRFAAAAMVLALIGWGGVLAYDWYQTDPVPQVSESDVKKVREEKARAVLGKWLPDAGERARFEQPLRKVMNLRFLANADAYQKRISMFDNVVDPAQFRDGKVLNFEVGPEKIQFVMLVDDRFVLQPDK